MAMVIAYDDVKANQRSKQHNGAKEVQTPFLGRRGNPDLPLASLVMFGPGRLSTPHFHDKDQFQIMVAGKGKMGRHDISVNSIHFSRAHTPYGPFIADAETGLSCLIIRSRPDSGAQHDPADIAKLSQIPGRNPWQITRAATFPEIGSSNVRLQEVPDISDDKGLAAYTLSMKPNSTVLTPDPSASNGLFVVVLAGSVLHEGKEAHALTLVYVNPRDGGYEVRSGNTGLEGFIVQFPREEAQIANAAKSGRAWQCGLCSFVYDEAAGLPSEGIAPGTRWEDLPPTWTCPDCAADKKDFAPAS